MGTELEYPSSSVFMASIARYIAPPCLYTSRHGERGVLLFFEGGHVYSCAIDYIQITQIEHITQKHEALTHVVQRQGIPAAIRPRRT